MLRLEQVNERLLQSAVSRLAESTQHSSRRSCGAWVERSAWRQTIPAVVPLRSTDELKGSADRLVSTRHLQFVEDEEGRERAEGLADG